MFYEDIFNPQKNEKEIQTLCTRLGVKYKKANISKKIRKSQVKNLSPKFRKHLIEHFEEIYTFTSNHFGYVPKSWEVDINSLKQTI